MSGTLEVDIDQVRANIKRIKAKTKSKFCAVVKANAYGVGTNLCKHIDDLVDYYAVACVSEANELALLTKKQILVLSPPTMQDIRKIKGNNICVAVDNLTVIKEIAKGKLQVGVHIAVNTGMNRFGVSYKTFCQILKTIKCANNIKLLGVFSHFYADGKHSKLQSNLFHKFVFCAKKFSSNVICHIANTSNTAFAFDMVRVGIGLYGKNQESLRLVSNIREVRTIKKGDVVGYNALFVAPTTMKIAVVPLGYADGILRKMTNFHVLIGGKYCKIVGSVCMDCFMVDITHTKANPQDIVTIFGENDGKQINVCQIASWCDTINYEILSRLGSRIQRKYICKSSEENLRAES